jgi:hypothetical protein
VNVKKAPQYNYTLLAKWNTPVNELGPRYKPTLPTIEQLKSSGNLRLLQNKEIVKKIMEYESFIFGTYMDHYNNVQNAATQVYRLEDQLCDYTDFISKLDDNMRHVMIAMVAGRRYEARLASTENSSALIRFVKENQAVQVAQ